MKVLFDRPNEISPSLYRRFFRRALFRGCMAGTTVSSDGPYLSLNALILSQSELASLAELSTRLARVFAIAGQHVAEDVDTLLAFGFPWSFAELLHQEPPRPVVFGRFDFLLDSSSRWQLLEYNCDTPAGFREATAVDEVAFELLRPYFKGARVNGDLAARRLAAIGAALQSDRRPVRLGLLTDASDKEDTGHMAYTERLIRTTLAADGVETVLGDIDNLRESRGGRVSLVGQPIDALYRYVTYEAMLALPQFYTIVEAVTSGRLTLLNGLRGMLLQNKGLLAWIWARRDEPLFSPEEQEAIKRHLPPTWWVRDLPGDVDLNKTVVKQVFGREGDEVYFGDAMSDADWEQCRKWGTFIVQQFVETAPLTSVGWDWQGRPVQRMRLATVGGYVASEKWAGCYSRLGNRIVNSRAEFVPTFAESKVDLRWCKINEP
ncbi:MAG: glutathionylspermidine synthase family protein [Chloroflexi bacterium]|nr:glutathionylspermidine synthase family protein [Chloroflexota bacterium]